MKILNWLQDWREQRRCDRERLAWCKTAYSPAIKEALSKELAKSDLFVAQEDAHTRMVDSLSKVRLVPRAPIYAKRIEPRTLSNLCDRMAEMMMGDSSWPKEWAPIESHGDEQVGSQDLSRCLEKYMQRFTDNIIAELGKPLC